MKDSDGIIQIYIVRRLICPSCHVLHVELPDFFEPHKHYARDVVERGINGDSKDIAADDSTIRRWKK